MNTAPRRPIWLWLPPSKEERRWMAEQDFKRALRLDAGPLSIIAIEAAKELCRAYQIDPDAIVHRFRPVFYLAEPLKPGDITPNQPAIVETRAWQLVMYQFSRRFYEAPQM